MTHRELPGPSPETIDASYTVSVAASLTGMHAQTLRQYDRLGLVSPGRARGRGRRYSSTDLDRLRRIQDLAKNEGINVAGVRRILDLEQRVQALQEEIATLRHALQETRSPTRGVFTADSSGRVQLRPHGPARASARREPVKPLPHDPPPAAQPDPSTAVELAKKRREIVRDRRLTGWQLLASLRLRQQVALRQQREGTR